MHHKVICGSKSTSIAVAHTLLLTQPRIAMPTNNRRTLIGLICFFLLTHFGALAVPTASAADANPALLEQRIAKLEAAANAPGINSGDNAWMLVSTAMVLLMTAPGLILFYGGLVRSKNVLGTMMHSLILMSVVSVLWVVYGYSMSFGESNAICGNPLQYFLLKGVGDAPNADYAATIPQQTFMLFQLMFAIITPALISGAFAERMKFTAFLVFTILWATIVYFPLCHMVWGKGGYFNWSLGGKVPVLDFAGGTVVHISSGVSALVCALVMGKRLGHPHEPMLPHNVVLSLIGTGLLWFGWFGFNGGSALAAGGLASSAFAATHFAAAAGGLGWALTEWWLKRRPSVLGAASGMVAGLATITPASGFVSVPSAILIGLAAGFACYMAVSKLKAKFGYDDTLDAFGVHGVGGIWGALATGLFADKAINGVSGLFQGDVGQFGLQVKAVLVTIVYSFVVSLVLLKIIDKLVGLRVTEHEERIGLDLTQHKEAGYTVLE